MTAWTTPEGIRRAAHKYEKARAVFEQRSIEMTERERIVLTEAMIRAGWWGEKSTTWEERMSARAAQRRRQLDEAVWTAKTVEHPLCMTGDGNVVAYPSTGLCIHCLNRPYGERRLDTDPDRCKQCWGGWQVWLGNAWGLSHVDPPSLFGCDHSCHEGEYWLAASGAPVVKELTG